MHTAATGGTVGVGRVGTTCLRAKTQDLARCVGSFEGGQVYHPHRHLESPNLAEVLIERVANDAALDSAPTWSTPGRP